MEYWSDGVLEYWSVGVLECWSVGVMEICWLRGQWGNDTPGSAFALYVEARLRPQNAIRTAATNPPLR
jgi:hypothetical protein